MDYFLERENVIGVGLLFESNKGENVCIWHLAKHVCLFSNYNCLLYKDVT